MSSKFKNEIAYIPHLDGLRGMAVLIILIYHARLLDLPGGYLGVDIFFVISGFIITKIIVTELSKNDFTFLKFYSRRVRRLAPALLITVLLTAFLLNKYLGSKELIEFAKSILYTLGFTSNIYWYTETDYHATESIRLPLLHTWSLAVEEQFYLFYPAIIVFLFSALKENRKQIGLSLILVALASLITSNYLSSENPEFSFYMLPTRIWELLMGAIIVFFGFSGESSRKASLVIYSSLALLCLSIYYFDSKTLHPSLITVIPVISTAGIIIYGHNTRVSKHLLENKVSVFLGKISYPLYLVHYPVIASFYLRHPEKIPTTFESLKLIILSLILASFIYFFVEKRMRYTSTAIFVPVVSVLTGLIIFISIFFIKTDGLKYRDKAIDELFEGTKYEDFYYKKNGKICLVDRSGKGCRFKQNNPKGLLINTGDSHGYTFANQARVLANQIDYDIDVINMTHCPYIPGAWRNTGFKAKCTLEMQAEARKYFLSIEPALIVMSVRYPMYLNSKQFNNGEGGIDRGLYLPFYRSEKYINTNVTVEKLIIEGINELAEYGHKIVLIYPIPEVGWNVPDLIRSKIRGHSSQRQKEIFKKLAITTSYEVYKKRVSKTKSVLDQIEHENVLKIYPEKIFCSDVVGRCFTHGDDGIYYRDDNHLSQVGTAKLRKHIFSKLETFLKPNI